MALLLCVAEAAPPQRTTVAQRPFPIYPGQSLQAAVDTAPAGTSFRIKAGVHRLVTLRPKPGDSFAGEAGAVLSGARLITTFSPSGSYWVAVGQTADGPVQGQCDPAYPQCGAPEELFIDDRPLRPVGSLAEVVPGAWFFDRSASRVYIGDNPTGKRVELSVTPAAFLPTANDVVISDLTIEKYASPAQEGAISAAGASGWTVTRTEVRFNHGLGIRVGTAMHVSGNRIHHNGQLGLGGSGDDLLIENNEISFNNTAHFDPRWEAGGAKFTSSSRLTVRLNSVHDNAGVGLWTDSDNVNTLYENNTCEDNAWNGILHEISYAAVIRGNVVRRNGFGFSDWIWGAGILVSASPDVEIYGNTVDANADGIGAVQQNRGDGVLGPHVVANLWVHDNTVVMAQGWTGLVQDVGDTTSFTSRNNRFDRNTYKLGGAGLHFVWMNGERTASEWRRYGMDVNGAFTQ